MYIQAVLLKDHHRETGDYVEKQSHRRRPRSWQVHFHGLLVSVRVSRLSKGKEEGNWLRRLFSRCTCFSVVTPEKAPSENWEVRKAEVSTWSPASGLS